MISLASLFRPDRRRKPKEVRTWTGWYAIINKHGHLSEVRPNQFAAQHALALRGDRDECHIVPVEVTIGRHHQDVPEHLLTKPKAKRKTTRKAKK